MLASGPAAWLYFNLLVSQSQIFVPVYDVAEAAEMSSTLWNAPDCLQVGWLGSWPLRGKAWRVCVCVCVGGGSGRCSDSAASTLSLVAVLVLSGLFSRLGWQECPWLLTNPSLFGLLLPQKSGFEQVADMALAFAVLGEVDDTGERGTLPLTAKPKGC